MFEIRKIPQDNQKTWELFQSGKTVGCFQLEKPYTGEWCHKVNPNKIEDLSDILSIIRPGCSQAIEDGKSMTQHYVDRKHGIEPVEYTVPELEPILKSTWNVLTYQEQAMQIAMAIAGFNEQQADTLRKAIGHKDTQIMSKVENEFLDGIKRVGKVSLEQGKEIFENIRKSQRYSFNRCVSKDTLLRRASKGKYNTAMSVEEMFLVRNDINYAKKTGHLSLYKKWKLLGNYGKGLSLSKDGRVRPNTILDIQFAGVKSVYRISLEDGSYIDVTSNHKFPTADGIKLCEELTTKDSLYTVLPYEKTTKKYGWSNVSLSELRVLASDRQHDGVTVGRTKKGEKGYPTQLTKIVSIERFSVENTYDVTMEGPDHNFVTDQNIITCNSHGVEYGTICYQTGYCKANYAIEFFCIYLQFAKERLDPFEEVHTLVNDAKDFGIEVLGPHLPDLQTDFYIKNEKIYFGLSNIKGIGENHVAALKLIFNGVDIRSLSFEQLAVNYLLKLNKTTTKHLILAGAIDYLLLDKIPTSRKAANYYISLLQELTDKELTWLQNFCNYNLSMADNLRALSQLKKNGGGAANSTRSDRLKQIADIYENPLINLQDNPEEIAVNESNLLGVSITCHITESYNGFQVTDFCSELRNSQKQTFNIGVSLIKVSEAVVKNGASAGMPMAFITADDKTGSINDLVVFAEAYAAFKDLLVEGNVVGLSGIRSKKNSLIVNKVWAL